MLPRRASTLSGEFKAAWSSLRNTSEVASDCFQLRLFWPACESLTVNGKAVILSLVWVWLR